MASVSELRRIIYYFIIISFQLVVNFFKKIYFKKGVQSPKSRVQSPESRVQSSFYPMPRKKLNGATTL